MKKLLLAFIATITLISSAYSEGLDIAPPPISSDIIIGEAGNQEQKGISFLRYESDGFDLTGLGFTLNNKNKRANGTISEMSLGANFMQGDGSGVDVSILAINMNLVFGKKIDMATLFIGPNLGTTMMSTDASSDNTFTYGFSGGIQGDFEVPFGLITPFYVYRSIYSSDFDATSTQLGLDMYFKKIDMSLATMIKSDDDGDMVFFSFKWTK